MKRLPEIGDFYYYAAELSPAFSEIVEVRAIYQSAGDRYEDLDTVSFMQPMDFNFLKYLVDPVRFPKESWQWNYTNNNFNFREDDFRKLVKNGILVELK